MPEEICDEFYLEKIEVGEIINEKFLYFKIDSKLTKVNPDDIVYIESMREYICLNMADKSQLITLMKVSEVAKQLSNMGFLRIHRSFIINMKKIEMPTEITFEQYGSRWNAFLTNLETSTVDPDDYTDDDWSILPEYEGEYIWLTSVDDQRYYGVPLIARRDDLLFECFYNTALYSDWGYHCPAAGHGLNDLGGEPDFVAVDENGEERFFAIV
mgnify:CR=1 FL=1